MATTAVRPARATTGPPKKRRSAGRILLGGILVTACAFASAAITLRTESPVGAIAVLADLPAGHTLTAEDLRAVKGTVDAEVIPAGEAAEVIGKRLTVPLVAGSLLARGNVGEPAYPAPGQALLGVAVKHGQYPPDIAPGDRVTVAAIPDLATPAGGTGPETAVAVVSRIRHPDQPQNPAVVTLQLSQSDAEKVAVPAARGLVSLMQISPEVS
ncbi:SAF domain-containing protein [Planobispora takensis]|uniref:SAF domain-containing protein n=1 Tax=Planobispora takensis TaxID=1367882 RepID=A0A8J3WR62_9ACTN|nr:SAF domain-containing protein [Planobispora takensis]GIH99198.1 hypothetical protein Pta02_12070 [Planobispora takensis]